MIELKRTKGKNSTPYIITICGSLRFTRFMLIAHHELTSRGFMVFLPDINLEEKIPEGSSPFNEDAQVVHDAKISFGDAIYICNIGGYIGESTFHEWKLARKLGKQIFWHDFEIDESMEKTRELLAKFDKEGKK